MEQFLFDYISFLAKGLTLLFLFGGFVLLIANVLPRQKGAENGQLIVRRLNDHIGNMSLALKSKILDDIALKHDQSVIASQKKRKLKERKKAFKKVAKLKDEEPGEGSDSNESDVKSSNNAYDKQEDKSETTSDKKVEVVEPLVDASNTANKDGKQKQVERKASEYQIQVGKDLLPSQPSKRLFVLEFDGDIYASQSKSLKQEVTALLSLTEAEDEVLVKLKSPGGVVHGYGYAASQLLRLRNKLHLTIAVDEVAASGGYMMACVAERIVAAPFAILGSIGVVAQVPNVHRFLKKHDIDVDVLTAGKYKRTLTMLGENTEEGRKKFLEDMEVAHNLFQQFIAEYRPEIDIDKVSTGEVWYGSKAVDMKLIDGIATSDEYILQKVFDDYDVFEVKWEVQKKPLEYFTNKMAAAVEKAVTSSVTHIVRRIF